MKRSNEREEKPVAAERIIAEITGEILGGRLRAGDGLPTEGELSVRYSASRAVVREAIQALKAQGLVVSRRGSGSYVAEKSWEAPLQRSLERYQALRGDILAYGELLELRILVECYCVKRVAGSGVAMQRVRERVLACLRRMETEREDLWRFGRADLDFHHAIVKGAGNALLATLFEGLMQGIGERFAEATYVSGELTERILADHRTIMAALKAEQAEAAASAMTAHLKWSRRHMEEVLKVSPCSASGSGIEKTRHSGDGAE